MSELSNAKFRMGSVLGRGVSTFFANFGVLITIALIAFTPLILAALVMTDPWAYEGGPLPTSLIVWSLSSYLLTLVLYAAVTFATFQTLRGEKPAVVVSLAQGLSRILPLLAIYIVSTVLVGLASLLFIIPGLIVYTMLWVAIPAAVVERPGVFGSLKRSRELTKGSRWSVFGIILLTGLVTFGVQWLAGLVFSESALGAAAPLFSTAATMAIVALTGTFSAVITAIGYHDLRAAKEGLKVEDIAAVFD